MKQMTRNIDPSEARDLLERVPRGCLSFATEHGPQAQPIACVWRDNRCFVGIPNEAQKPNADQEVVLLIDEGEYFFDLRAIYVRGTVQPCEAPPNALDGCMWFELTPLKVVAWDYGTLHEVIDED